MNAHSTILGGSNAARLLACPASYLEQQRAPVVDVESEYAAEGTFLHTKMPDLVTGKKTVADFNDLTEEQIQTVIKALAALNELMVKYAGDKPWQAIRLEGSLPLPGVTGAFGTVDLIIVNDRFVIVLDWKFGSGVPVSALYTMPDGSEQLNAQLAFYACCARSAHPKFFKSRRIVLAVVQPRLEPTYTEAETTLAELSDFYKAFSNAVVEALARNAHRERGEHCRFATCKATCPLWTGPLLDLSALDPTKAALTASTTGNLTEYGAFLSTAMDLAEMAETWAAEIRRQSHVFLEDSGQIRGWKLVPKRGTRQWREPENVPATLAAAGALQADMYTEPELRSVAQMEKALKKKGIVVPDDLYQIVSTGTTIARTDDKRPESTHVTSVAALRQALKAL